MTPAEEIDWELVSEIRASKRRSQVLQKLAEQPMMNSELAEELGVSTHWARKQVKWLEKRGLVKELTESKHNYKLYTSTEEGDILVDYI